MFYHRAKECVLYLCHKVVVMPKCKMTLGIGEISEELRVLVALADDLSFIPRTHIRWTNCNSTSRGEDDFFWPL